MSAHLVWLLGTHTAVRIRPDGVIIGNVLVRRVIPCEIPGQMLLLIAKRRFYSAPATGLTGDQLTEFREFGASPNAHRARPLPGA